MIFINNNEIFSPNYGFDFLLFLVTSFYCTLRIPKIIFPESGHSYLNININIIFCGFIPIYFLHNILGNIIIFKLNGSLLKYNNY